MPKKFRLSNRKTHTKTDSQGSKQRADGVQKSSIQKNAPPFGGNQGSTNARTSSTSSRRSSSKKSHKCTPL